MCEFDLVRYGTPIHLDLHQVCLLLRETCLADLGVCEDADDGAVFADALEFAGDRLSAVLGVLESIAGEGLLLAAIPVLVEASLDLVREVGSPNGGQRPEPAWGLDVADDADDDHGWYLDDGDSFHHFTLVHL